MGKLDAWTGQQFSGKTQSPGSRVSLKINIYGRGSPCCLLLEHRREIGSPLGVPEGIRSRPPTTDTYSLPLSQEEFCFSLPHCAMDRCLFGKNNDVPVEDIGAATGLTVEQVNRVFRDIDQRPKTTQYLYLGPELADDVSEISRALKP